VYIVRPQEQNGRLPIAGLPTPKSMVAMTVALGGRLEGLLIFDNLDDAKRLQQLGPPAPDALARARDRRRGQGAHARDRAGEDHQLQKQKEQVEQAYDNVELSAASARHHGKLSIEEIISTVYQNVNSLMDAAVFGIGLYNEAEARLEFPAPRERRAAAPFSYALGRRIAAGGGVLRATPGDRHRGHATRAPAYIKNYKPPWPGNPGITAVPAAALQGPRDRRHHGAELPQARVLRLPRQHPPQPRTYATIALENADAYRRLTATLDPPEGHAGAAGRTGEAGLARRAHAGIAHEIKNPLNFVNNFAELSVELAEELRQETRTCERSARCCDFDLLQSLATDLR
jgi:hypothetical protein